MSITKEPAGETSPTIYPALNRRIAAMGMTDSVLMTRKGVIAAMEEAYELGVAEEKRYHDEYGPR